MPSANASARPRARPHRGSRPDARPDQAAAPCRVALRRLRPRHPRAGSPDHFWRCLSVKVAPMKGLSFQQVIAMAKEATLFGADPSCGWIAAAIARICSGEIKGQSRCSIYKLSV